MGVQRILLTLAVIGAVAAPGAAAASIPTCAPQLALQQHTGVCKAGPVTARFAAVHYPLRLHTLALSFVSWRQTQRVSSHFSSKQAKPGTFLVLTMHLTNETAEANGYQPSQAELIIGRNVYAESLTAEDGPDEHSLLWQDGADAGLPAGKSEAGDMVFEVPSSAIAQFKAGQAALVIGDYGTSVASSLPAGVGLLYF